MRKKILSRCSVASLVLIRAGLISSAWAQPSQVSIQWELVDRPITLYEPVLVRLTVENRSGAEVAHLDLGANQRAALSFLIVEPGGTRDERPSLVPTGFSPVGAIEIAPNDKYVRDFVVNEWYRFDVPGEYEIHVGLRTPITLGGHTLGTETGTSLRCVIGPRDERALHLRGKTLVDNLLASRDTGEAMQIALALSYVSDPIAIPYLKEALFSPLAAARYVAIKGLGRFTNTEAIEALLKLVRDPGPDRDVAIGTVGMLAASIPDVQLREQVREALETAARH